MSVCTLTCRTCGTMYDLSPGENHKPCPACGAENCRPQAEADVGDILRRATGQRLRCDFKHAEASYQFVLNTSPDEHEALWGLVQCRYAVEYVKDPRTGKPMPIVHAVRTRPMLTDPDFREACDLAPEAVRAQYRQEAEYIDNAMARIRELAAKGDAYDVFLCHKTTRTDGEEGYTEDFKRATQLYMKLEKAGHRVFFAPFAGLTAGDNYEAGIYHAIDTAKVMLVICSNQDYINSPWVRTEWQRFLEMSYEPGADKHLIPLLYDSFPPRRLPDDFRQLQAITMGELDAAETLMAAVEKHVGARGAAQVPDPAPVPAPVQQPRPMQPAPQPEPPKPAQPTPAYAPESHFTTEAADGGVAITKYTGPGGEVLIPPTIGGKRVVEIGEGAFEEGAFEEQEKLTKVVIPAGVTSIGWGAFSGCSSLTSVSIPESVTRIGDWAFSGCSSLTSVNIPESVISIGKSAFDDCISLTSITIPGSVTSIGYAAFDPVGVALHVQPDTYAHQYAEEHRIPYELIGLTPDPENPFITKAASGGVAIAGYTGPGGDVQIPTTINGRKVVEIGDSAFEKQERLTRVTIPDGVTSIGSFAFDGCSGLTSITMPESVTSIGGWAYRGCSSLTSATIPAGLTRMGDGAFEGCISLTRIDIPDSVTSVGGYAFMNCTGLTGVKIPCHLTSIENRTFFGCTSLADITIPDSVTRIGEAAFSGCTSMTKAFVPKTVLDIENGAFDGCPSLTLRVHPVSPVRRYAMKNKVPYELITPAPASQPTPAYAPESHFTTEAVDGGVAITKYTGPGGEVLIPPTIGGKQVAAIGDLAFKNQEKVTGVVIPHGVRRIEDCAFEGCRELKNVDIPESVTSIEWGAFKNCRSLASVRIPAGVTSIEDMMFRGCSGLASVQIPMGVTSIGEYAFAYCRLLWDITIPESVTSIGESAFDDCSNLVELNIPAGVTHIGAGAFAQCKKLMSVRIPAGVTSIGEKAFWWCSSLTNVSIPAGVTSIGESAFSGCDMLTSVSLPASVTSIGEYAFHDCEKLASVQIPPSVQDIGTGAFQGCSNLTLRVHPNTVAYVYARKNDLRFELIQKLLPPEPVQFRNEPAPRPTQPTPKPTLLSRLFGKK